RRSRGRAPARPARRRHRACGRSSCPRRAGTAACGDRAAARVRPWGNVQFYGWAVLVGFADAVTFLPATRLGPAPLTSLRPARQGKPMRRRHFIALVGGAAVWPLAARAQQPAMPVIGFLGSASPDTYGVRLRAFSQGLKEQGYVEGQNVAIEYRWAEDHYDRLPQLAAELGQRHVKVMVAGGGTPFAIAAKAATATIPIVFEVAIDPIKAGLVDSLNRPGSNVTGVVNLNVEIAPKWLELLRELIP